MDLEKLTRMEQASLAELGSDSLTDISDVPISGDTSMERLENLVLHLKNLYCFRVGKTPVRISFNENGPTLEHTITRYFMGLKQGVKI